MIVRALHRFQLNWRTVQRGDIVALSPEAADRLLLAGTVLLVSESESPSTRNSVIELKPHDPDDPALLERMKRAEQRWKAGASFDACGDPFSGEEEEYVPLKNPAAEAMREWFHRALDASAERYAARHDSVTRDQARRQAFAASLQGRIDELLASRPTL